MSIRRRLLFMAAGLSVALLAASAAHARTIVFISDLHMGLGRDADGAWHETEDFRWPSALEGFLAHISESHDGEVDLVIAGDFLELWQMPAGVDCKGPNSNYGCTLEEVETTLRAVLAAHERELKTFARFASREGEGSNCIHFIPGNHDAVFVIDSLWTLVADALQSSTSCIERVSSGTWISDDGRVVAEHGHQIGRDPNRYPDWPVVTDEIDGVTYVRRPWGERFVQSIFNEEEAQYPLIDNLSPVSAGTKYRVADGGVIATVGDVARLLKFNLFETSLSQKVQILGEVEDGEPPRWDIQAARRLGADLFSGALASNDPLAELIRQDEALRAELATLALDTSRLPDDEVTGLCDQIAVREAQLQCRTEGRPTLGAGVERLLSSRERVVRPYIVHKSRQHTAMRVFVYGHTHAFELEWPVELNSLVSVSVLNDGAFQRVIDDGKFRARVGSTNAKDLGEGLRTLDLEALPACYTFVTVNETSAGGLEQTLAAWFMEENSAGESIDICDSRCADVGHGCP